jgi:hypothetical protein
MMETSPLLARREIPLRERLQKSLLVLIATVIAAAGAWYLTGASAKLEGRSLLLTGAIVALGLIVSLYFALKTHDRTKTREGYRSVRRRIDDDRQGRGWISRLSYNLLRFLTGVFVAIGLLIALAGAGVLALQVYGYLRTGIWRSISLLSVAAVYLPWLGNPQSWFGLNMIVRDAAGLMPLSLALVLLGVLVAGFAAGLRQGAAR